MSLPEKVIVIDDSGSEEESSQKTKNKPNEGPAADECVTAEMCKDTLDFTELTKLLEGPQVKSGKKRRVCCNSWCLNPAAVAPEENIRDYYNIPSGTSFRLCRPCVDHYYGYVATAELNLEKGGNMLEDRCQLFNEFIILDNEPDEQQVEESDPEFERLLGFAVKENLVQLNKQVGLLNSLVKSKDQVYDMLTKFATEGGEADKVSKTIAAVESDLYREAERFKANFRPPHKLLPELDVLMSGTGSVQTPRLIARNGLEGNNACQPGSHLSEPADLPPFGELVKPPPKLGQTFYSHRAGSSSDWIKYQINQVVYDSDEHGCFSERFNIETTLDGLIIKRSVNGDSLAYCTVSTVRLGIGSRVIGGFNHNRRGQPPKVFYPGMVAELPTVINRFRYLVFFDDGKAHYCPHEDLKVVYKPMKRIHEYFTGFQSEFVENYLSSFPERLMVRTSNDQILRVELNGFWISAKVDRTDGSLVHVCFMNGERSEWIYRGSPRLRPMYDRLQSRLPSSEVRPAPGTAIQPARRSSASQGSQLQRARAEYEIIIESSDSDDDDDEEEAAASNEYTRAVARKSTSRQHQQPTASLSKRVMEKRVTRSNVLRRYPPVILEPKSFHWHKCSRTCVSWVKYAESKTRGIHPLAIPSIFAFHRETEMMSAVAYLAPCGKKLKNIQEVLKYLSETLIPLTLDMFDFDLRTQIFDEFVVAPQFVLMEDISYKAERNAIPCINDIDYECPDLMMYMTERRPLEGVNINLDPGFLVCCDCVDNCRDRSKCRCWRLTIDCFKPFNVGEDKRHITKIGYQYQRLDQNILSGIYECNSNCKCNQVTCINRVVQHPMRHKLQLFKTPKKGWGTRCVNDVPQGVFICTYVGNILTELAANETGTINGDEYFAELDHIEVMASSKADYEAQAALMSADDEEKSSDDSSSGEVESVATRNSHSARAVRSCTLSKRSKRSFPAPAAAQPSDQPQQIVVTSSDSEEEIDSIRQFYGAKEAVYVMDAKIAGNIGRYFNHSCDPNIFVQNVYVDTHDLRFPWVAFFALRHIPAGAELTWDYGYKIGSVPGKVLYCYCGAPNCRKRLL